MSYRNVCITVNNPVLPPMWSVYLGALLIDQAERERVASMPPLQPPFDPIAEWGPTTYAVYQFEVSATGTLHMQVYVEFSTSVRLRTIQSYPGLEGCHVERRRGSSEQAAAYCKKRDPSFLYGYWEFGTIARQGRRSDLESVRRDIDEGASELQVAQNHFGSFCRYHRSFSLYRRLSATKRNWPMEILVFYGPTGTGKTRHAYETYPNAYFQPPGQWFDDYAGEETVIIDEMVGSRFSFRMLLLMCDRYPYKVQVKGSFREFTSRRIVFTSNYHPAEWYGNLKLKYNWPGYGEQFDSLETNPFSRRITTLRRFGQVGIRVQNYPLIPVVNDNGIEELRHPTERRNQ